MKKVLLAFGFLIAVSTAAIAQSTDPTQPAPITAAELSATVKARDVGDPRQTTYYYAFEGTRGDIFINVVSRNFTGDLDVFLETGMRPLTKMVFYGDAEPTETGRLIYLRKPERLILRLQGRTPGDDPATLNIKFAGSFVALSPTNTEKEPTIEDRSSDSQVIVNSVGTIIGTRPKPRPTPVAIAKKDEAEPAATPSGREVAKASEPKPAATAKAPVRKKPLVVVDDYPGVSESSTKKETRPTAKTPAKPTKRVERTAAAPREPKPEVKAPAVDPLAGVKLVITLKDGDVVEKMLTDLIRFTFDKGVLTVIAKDGGITRYQMTTVASVNVQ